MALKKTSSVEFPKDVKSTACTKRTQSFIVPTTHGTRKVEKQFTNENIVKGKK